MFIVKRQRSFISSLPAKEIVGADAGAFASALSQRILRELAARPAYPMELARRLRENEQKVYYHVRRLEKAGMIKTVGTRAVMGVRAGIYGISEPAFFIKFRDFETTQKIKDIIEPLPFIEPFVESGRLNATIVVGSPDPHGPQKARSRDGYYAIDLGLFIGTFLNHVPKLNVRLDTEVRDKELDGNLIIIGGPIVNTICSRVNRRLPIRFDEKDNLNIVSALSGRKYSSDESGIIVKAKSPFNAKKSILVIAGRRHSGTRAVLLAFLNHYAEIVRGNSHNPKYLAKAVEGVDLDSDGIVDSVEILE